MANQRHLSLPRLPRMADFAGWVSAAGPALGWDPGTFLAAYDRNRLDAHDLALDAASITGPVKALVNDADWQGTATALLARLTQIAGEAIVRRKDWPAAPNALSGQLSRLAPDFRAIGIEIDTRDRAAGTGARSVSIRRIDPQETVTTVTGVTPPGAPDPSTAEGDDRDDLQPPDSHGRGAGMPDHAPDPEDYADATWVAAAWGVDIESDYPPSAWRIDDELATGADAEDPWR